MPAPYPRRGQQQGQARALNRGARGMAQGRYAGLSPVSRQQRRALVETTASSALHNVGWISYAMSGGATLGDHIYFTDGIYDQDGDLSWFTELSGGSPADGFLFYDDEGIYALEMHWVTDVDPDGFAPLLVADAGGGFGRRIESAAPAVTFPAVLPAVQLWRGGTSLVWGAFGTGNDISCSIGNYSTGTTDPTLTELVATISHFV